MLQLYSGVSPIRSGDFKSAANKLESLENGRSLLQAQPFYPVYLEDIYTDIGKDMIEELADDVFLIYRPYYYGLIEDADGRDTRNRTTLIVAKNKAGQGREVHFRFNPENLEWVEV